MANVENVVFLSLVLDLFGNLLDPLPRFAESDANL